MIYAKERAQVICDELKKLRKVHRFDMTDWQVKDGLFLHPEDADRDAAEWKPFDSRTMRWYGPDRHYWFRTSFSVSDDFAGKPLYLIVHTQIDEWDDGKNPQFLLFVNGEATQGLDMNHREVLLTRSAKPGEEFTVDLQAYTGTLHTEFWLIGEAAEIEPEINGLYYDLQVPVWALDRMEKGSQIRSQIETAVDETVNRIDLRHAYTPEFYDSVRAARAYIRKTLYEDLAGFSDVVATCIGHTHIDVAWWWTVAQTREKVARSFSTVLKLMDEYPHYKFMSSQPQLYAFLKARYPELFARIKQRVAEGRWEPEGGMWVEADCNLSSGESLVRQFLFGKRFFKEEFNKDNRVLWLPDVFGYSAALPQIMKKCGIDYFMTTKLSWNQFNRIPHDTFMWRGIDGSEVLTHFVSTLGIGQKQEEGFTTYNGMLHPDALMGGWERYQDKAINNDILISFGYGDGGGGPTRQMLETAERMSRGVKGIPRVRQEFSRRYFEELDERVRDNPQLAKWEGELYFEYHRGTYTSMARNKRGNRKSELMLMDLELLSVLAMANGVAYPKEELESMWRTVLLNQFHDILPGSAIKEVYEVTKKEYAELAQKGSRLLEERLKALSGSGDALTVFNTLGFERDALVELKDAAADVRSVDVSGKKYPVQRTGEGAVCYIPCLPSKGSAAFALSAEPAAARSVFQIDDDGIETPFYTVRIDSNGWFTSVYDKENEREVLQPGATGNRMRVYEDKPIYFDNWNIDIYYKEKFWDVDDVEKMEWTETGPVRATLLIERKFAQSTIRQKVHFYADSRRIDFETVVDWHEHQHLLKVHFPVEIHTDEATAEIQFGNVTRKTHRNTSWDVARFECCCHRWFDLSESGYGVSLLNDCKYGYSAYQGDMALTLIKSGIEPNPTADQEKHVFTYALYPHAGGWREGGTAREAAKLNQPAYAVRGGKAGAERSLFRIDAANVMADTVKLAEDGSGIILRMYEYQNGRGPVTVRMEKAIRSVSECDLLENPVRELEHGEKQFTFPIRPYEIKTYKIVLK